MDLLLQHPYIKQTAAKSTSHMSMCSLYVGNHTFCFVFKFYNSFIVGHSKHLGLQYHQVWSPPYISNIP